MKIPKIINVGSNSNNRVPILNELVTVALDVTLTNISICASVSPDAGDHVEADCV